ncbi:MAG: hypothetical protein LH609_03615 [Rudanella sp.]|nr:hypothetical protein [Rudanella sp.]
MKPLAGQLLFLLLLTLTLPAIGQRIQRPQFRTIVYLKDGSRINGVPDDIENGELYFIPYEPIYYRHTQLKLSSISLDDIAWVVIRRTDKRKAIRTGIVIGGLAGGYFGYQSSQKSKFRSPILAGVSIALSAAALGGVGAIIGSFAGVSVRRTVRPLDRDNPVESLERQLRPFTKVYLDGIQFDQRNPAVISPR